MKKNILSAGLSDAVIGIAGFGRLGRSLAAPLVRNGFSREHLMISHGGSEATHARAVELGFGPCLTDTLTLMSSADIVIAATRPQDVLALPGDAVAEGALVISCMAGLPLDLLGMIFHGEIRRMMCSGPDTISAGRGVATMYPSDPRTDELLRLMGMRVLAASSEEELDSFTVGICIPAILLNVRVGQNEVRDALARMERRYPLYGELQDWISEIVPENSEADEADRRTSLENVSTKGGITQAMTEALLGGALFGSALMRGMERGREITDDIRSLVTASEKYAV
ncbi:MAG: NAD(P)-binding domain-containing protein [Synergistaceae bacterium]|jgi:pyrroline-5-carboxylate reductase|nr:NAD(P)-binding domain-containing protein [Synergistaceae bacterium]